MQFYIMNDMLMSKSGNETLTVEAFGKNSLRIRSYIDEKIDGNCFALTGKSDFKPEITVTESSATVKNGKIICNIAKNGAVTFYKYLVAPVTYQGVTKRDVYLPDGKWKNIFTEEIFNAPLSVNADAPLDIIPVFEKLS